MSGIVFLMFVQSLVQFETKEGKREGYCGEKIYLDMSFKKLDASIRDANCLI